VCRDIYELLGLSSPEVDREQSISEEGEEEDNELYHRHPFKESMGTLQRWLSDVPPEDMEVPLGNIPAQEEVLFQLPDHQRFIQQSEAYRELLLNIHNHSQLTFGNPNRMFDIGDTLRRQVRGQESFRRISRRRPFPLVRMTFILDWNPIHFLCEQGCVRPFSDDLGKILCLTGSWDEAQAATVLEYMTQTWPVHGDLIIGLLQKLIALPEGQECSCKF
jgi:hypothetical protein